MNVKHLFVEIRDEDLRHLGRIVYVLYLGQVLIVAALDQAPSDAHHAVRRRSNQLVEHMHVLAARAIRVQTGPLRIRAGALARLDELRLLSTLLVVQTLPTPIRFDAPFRRVQQLLVLFADLLVLARVLWDSGGQHHVSRV